MLFVDVPMYELIIIGGGAAGMFAAVNAAAMGVKVLLLERNKRLGAKLLLTGKGRCNLTNNCSVNELLENTPTGRRFLYSAYNRFSPSDTMDFFTELGVTLTTERGGRVFPSSMRSSDIVLALEKKLKALGVTQSQGRAKAITKKDNGLLVTLFSGESFSAQTVLLATGGKSYPKTGSSGDGYIIAEKLGHNITSLKASLVPLVTKGDDCRKMQGLSLKNVGIKVINRSKKVLFEDFGELLFTHYGISGPLALSASAHMKDFEKNEYSVILDLKPGLDESKLDARILRDFEKSKNRSFSNTIADLHSKSMIPVLINRTEIPPFTKVHSISREQRKSLVRVLKEFQLDILEPRPIEEAVITSGGVDLREINPKTMESKLINGLFFAGEVIDADAYTGGFNLQIAWSTSFVAAKAVANKLGEATT